MKNKKIILTTLSPKTHRTSEENLGIEYLKSVLVKEGYEVEIIDAWLNELEVEDVYSKIISQNDKLLFIGISSYMSNTAPTIQLISMLKKYDENIKIVCGGFGPTFYPEDYLKSDFLPLPLNVLFQKAILCTKGLYPLPSALTAGHNLHRNLQEYEI